MRDEFEALMLAERFVSVRYTRSPVAHKPSCAAGVRAWVTAWQAGARSNRDPGSAAGDGVRLR